MYYALALSAAFLFALSVPAGKLLLAHLRPLELSALCYLGGGLGLAGWLLAARGDGREAGLERATCLTSPVSCLPEAR